MNILYYIPSLSQKGGGSRQYAIALLKILTEDEVNQYYILNNDQDSQVKNIINGRKNFYLIPEFISRERSYEYHLKNIIKLYNFIARIKGGNWKLLNWSYVQRICNMYKIDLIHSPFQHVPYSSRKTVWTLHDVQELHFPEYFSAYEREGRARTWLDNINRGKHIVVSYNHVKDDIVKYFQLKPNDISICLLNMENLWVNNYNSEDIDYDFQKLLPEKFLLYPANTWEHKNHINLIKAIFHLKIKGITEVRVVCTGYQTPYFFKSILPIIEEYNLQSQIIFLGLIEESKLFTLYKKTLGVIVPTKYEAGSFPLVESILLGVPVVCSNVTSLPETIGDSKYVFNPDSIEEISLMIEKLYFDDDFRNDNVENSLKQKNKLFDLNIKNKILDIYSSVLKI